MGWRFAGAPWGLLAGASACPGRQGQGPGVEAARPPGRLFCQEPLTLDTHPAVCFGVEERPRHLGCGCHRPRSTASPGALGWSRAHGPKRVSRRLSVGGLGHVVSKAELRERFSKFGHVLDAEIITRKNDQGNRNAMKAFAYITVSISDADLRKCMSILNKKKRKGGTLQIELAKESFLHRLTMEREEAKLQGEKPQRNDKASLSESLKKAGVVDFHMKAVPGAEVPDRKKWVVGKFGRVLPILHLRSQQKNKIVKYDPSKYCHNLRKLEPDLADVVPVSGLTWHLEGRDDSINKKRQGEFPATKKPPKKLRQLGSEALNGAVVLSSGCQSHSKNTSSPQLAQRSKSKPNEKSKLPPARSPNSKKTERGLLSDKSTVSGVTAQNNRSVSGGDIDSEEEIRAMVKNEREIQKAEHVETESGRLEIVGANFELKDNSHWSLSNLDAMKKATQGGYREKEIMECENGYNSADTDEIIAESKTPDRSSRETAILEDFKQVKVENKELLTNRRHGLGSDSSLKTHNLKEECIGKKGKMKKSKSSALRSTAVNSATKTRDSESSSSEPDKGESEITSGYESTMQNCHHLALTLDDLKALATEKLGTLVEESGSTQSSSQHSAEEDPMGNVVNKTKLSKFPPAYSLEGSSKKRQNMGCEQHKELSGAASLADERDQPVSRQCLRGKSKDVSSLQDNQNSERGGAAADTEEEHSDVDSKAAVSQKHVKRPFSPKLLSQKLKRDVSNKNRDCEANKCENGKRSLLENKELCLHATASKEPRTKEKDNQRRLAALEESKERELEKQLIQGAFSNLDSQPAGKHEHVLFNSDVESEAEVRSLGNAHEEEEPASKILGRLFEINEDKQDDRDNERFKIKPHFEGKAGEKLLELQSRFGTDERFRVDARFLESDSEEEEETNILKAGDEEEVLAVEKRKNLQILGSLLDINLEHPKSTKAATSAKRFKDINALRYDPTQQDHAVFERKRGATEKESKGKRKKKREESEKLPEVSEEMNYDVAVDLLFRSSKSRSEKIILWDKDDAEDSTPPDHLGPNVGSNVAQESSGFTFSFFGDMEESGVKEEPYILETIKPVKVTWQEDPHFQDSSSEGDDEPEASESERDKEVFFSLLRTERARFFFFCNDDEQLREGSKLFCGSLDLGEKDGWEHRRRLLLEECWKKHKDARRKVKAKQIFLLLLV
ncbi:LOW QUALITY PROTEIN: nucleolar protein 8-like [Leptosomus discolor]